jgi:hypothetical protein
MMIRLAVSILVLAALTGQVPAAEVLRPASVRFAAGDETPNFRRHVLPLMGRLGCNGRACHGSFQGQGGFRLSLFGYDFKADHDALTKGEVPRVDVQDPADSLMLKKPTLTIAHKGGRRMAVESWQYWLFLRWIKAGAKNDSSKAGDLERLTVSPSRFVFHRPGEQFQLRVLAHWSDGTSEDVTDLSRFRTNDDAIATVDDSGRVTAAGKGDTHVVAFYDNGVAPVQVMLPVSDLVGERYPSVPTPKRVDELVVAKLRETGIRPSELCTDAEFLRRVSLDLTGTLPTPAEVEAFLADGTSDKRSRKIQELLDRPSYVSWWTTRLCDITGNNGRYRDQRFGPDFARQWYEWIHHRVKENMGYDKIVAGMVLATSRRPGESLEEYSQEMSTYFRKDHPADFALHPTLPQYWARQTFERPEEKALGFAYTFLGIRLQCAQCHKHPFDQWTKQDFEQFTGFFRPILYGTRPQDREAFAKMDKALTDDPMLKGKNLDAVRADLVHAGKTVPFREVYVAQPGDNGGKGIPPKQPAKKKVPPPPRETVLRLLGGERVKVKTGDDPRQALLDWILRPDNPYFARALVNRVWANYFGVGIVEPADDLSLANPPSNGPLLEYLTRGFVENGYDLKWLHREITMSRTYQLSWKPNDTNRLDNRNFSHALTRRLPAEVAYDAVVQATASPEETSVLRADSTQRAIGPDTGPFGKNRARYALMVFGKPDRVSNCDCERSNDPSLLQTLYLFNDGELLALVDRRGGWVSQISQRYGSPAKAAAADKDAKPRALAATNLERRIRQLEKEGKSDEATPLKRVLQAVRTPRTQGPAKVPPARPAPRPVGPGEERALIREAYLRSVSRLPTEAEVAQARQYLKESPNPVAGMRDLVWALLNTNEFIVNH